MGNKANNPLSKEFIKDPPAAPPPKQKRMKGRRGDLTIRPQVCGIVPCGKTSHGLPLELYNAADGFHNTTALRKKHKMKHLASMHHHEKDDDGGFIDGSVPIIPWQRR